MEQNEQDILKTMFSQLQEEKLPQAFQADMMGRIRQEALRIAKRNQLIQNLLLIGALVCVIGLGIGVFVYLKILPMSLDFIRIDYWQIVHSFPHVSIPSSYLAFSFLVVILLVADYLLRQAYHKRHEG